MMYKKHHPTRANDRKLLTEELSTANGCNGKRNRNASLTKWQWLLHSCYWDTWYIDFQWLTHGELLVEVVSEPARFFPLLVKRLLVPCWSWLTRPWCALFWSRSLPGSCSFSWFFVILWILTVFGYVWPMAWEERDMKKPVLLLICLWIGRYW